MMAICGWYLAKLPSDSSASATSTSPLPAWPPSKRGTVRALDGSRRWRSLDRRVRLLRRSRECATAWSWSWSCRARRPRSPHVSPFMSRARMSLRCTMRSPCRVRCDDFRIVRLDGAGVDTTVLWPGRRSSARCPNSTVMPRRLQVGRFWRCAARSEPSTATSFGVQHFGQNAHACAADADEMGGA